VGRAEKSGGIPEVGARMNNPQPPWLASPPAEVAAVILPWFGSQTPPLVEGFATKKIARWLSGGSDRGAMTWHPKEPFEKPEIGAVAEAIQILERACLLMRSFGSEQTFIGLTRLGAHALRTNTVRQHLGLSDPPA
jgi:hypothetical protein